MVRDLEYRKALAENPAHRAVSAMYDLEPFEVFDSWVETFLRLYDTWDDPREADHRPGNVAIVDFLDRGVVREFEEFARRFQKAGVFCQIADPRDMKYEDGILYSKEGWPTGD